MTRMVSQQGQQERVSCSLGPSLLSREGGRLGDGGGKAVVTPVYKSQSTE